MHTQINPYTAYKYCIQRISTPEKHGADLCTSFDKAIGLTATNKQDKKNKGVFPLVYNRAVYYTNGIKRSL